MLPRCKQLMVVLEDIMMNKNKIENSTKQVTESAQSTNDSVYHIPVENDIVYEDENIIVRIITNSTKTVNDPGDINRLEDTSDLGNTDVANTHNVINNDPRYTVECENASDSNNVNSDPNPHEPDNSWASAIKFFSYSLLRDNESLNKLFICDICSKPFRRKSPLIQHIRKHARYYICDYCGYKTNNKKTLCVHINSVHTKSISFSCTLCNYTAYRKFHLTRHIRNKHMETEKTKEIKAKNNKTERTIIYNCSYCSFKTHLKHSIVKHNKNKHTEKPSFNCTFCSYKTSVKNNYDRHVKAKHTVTVFNCPYCGYTTLHKSALNQHIKKVHIKSTYYYCPDCSFKTCDKSSLRQHISSKDASNAIFNCSYCSFNSCIKRSLSVHINAVHHRVEKYKEDLSHLLFPLSR